MSSIQKSKKDLAPRLYPKYIQEKRLERDRLGIVASASTIKVEDMLAETFYRINARVEQTKKEKDPNYKTLEERWEQKCWYILL